MADGDELLNAVDWGLAVQAVIDSGWCRVPGAISADQADRLYIGPSRDRSLDTWQTARGDLVILRAFGWPVTEARCVVHGVEPPPAGQRLIMTFRHNRGGAGADYFNS